jgi:hypothetical protein
VLWFITSLKVVVLSASAVKIVYSLSGHLQSSGRDSPAELGDPVAAESTLGGFPDGDGVPLDATSIRHEWKGEPQQEAAVLARQRYQAASGRVRLQ